MPESQPGKSLEALEKWLEDTVEFNNPEVVLSPEVKADVMIRLLERLQIKGVLNNPENPIFE